MSDHMLLAFAMYLAWFVGFFVVCVSVFSGSFVFNLYVYDLVFLFIMLFVLFGLYFRLIGTDHVLFL